VVVAAVEEQPMLEVELVALEEIPPSAHSRQAAASEGLVVQRQA
jgi:hypothetical protein